MFRMSQHFTVLSSLPETILLPLTNIADVTELQKGKDKKWIVTESFISHFFEYNRKLVITEQLKNLFDRGSSLYLANFNKVLCSSSNKMATYNTWVVQHAYQCHRTSCTQKYRFI